MTVTQERFEQGLTYQAYKAQMSTNQERFAVTEETVALNPDDVAYFVNLPHAFNVVVLAEDWCGDVIANLPVLGRLAQASGKLNLRIFLRDQNLDIMDQYLKEGQFRAIPTLVFFDHEFNELGHWIERPVQMSERLAQARRDAFANDPLLAPFAPNTPFSQLPEAARDRLRAVLDQFRKEHRAFSDQEVVREIRAILEHGKLQVRESREPSIAPPPIKGDAGPRAASTNVKVSIVYCAECGYQPQTLALTSALVDAFVHEVSSIELIPWRDGAFDVVVNGDLVHSMLRDGGFPEHETILAAVREHLETQDGNAR